MLSKRGVDYLAGGLLLATVVTLIVFFVTNPISAGTFREDPAGVLRDLAENQTQFVVSAFFFIAQSFIAIPLAATLYMAFRAHDRNLALIGSFGFLVAGVVNLTVAMIFISAESLSDGFAEASGAQAETILNSALAVGFMADAGTIMGMTAVGIAVLSYGLLVVTTGALPRWIGVIGVLGGLVAQFGWLMYAENDLVGIGGTGLLIGLLFALVAGSWLVLKGSSEANEMAST